MTLGDRRGIDRHVYGAAEDSALLAAATVRELDRPCRVLDVGTGSGFVARRLVEAGHGVVGSDVNPHACRRARSAGIEVVRCDLVAAFAPKTFDVVTFNPPYLPAVEETDLDPWFDVAITGGPTGRAVIERFLDDVGRVLDDGGRVFLLASSLAGIDDVRERAETAGFDSAVVAEDEYPGEVLAVLRFRAHTANRDINQSN